MPVSGEAVPLSEVQDQVFSGEVLGKGAAIIPSEGKVYAPTDGNITLFFDTGHAIGMKTGHGAESLIHVGSDTGNLQGRYFTPEAKMGDTVKKGDLLLSFDVDRIKSEGYDTVIPVIVTNTDAYQTVDMIKSGDGKAGDDFLQLA